MKLDLLIKILAEEKPRLQRALKGKGAETDSSTRLKGDDWNDELSNEPAYITHLNSHDLDEQRKRALNILDSNFSRQSHQQIVVDRNLSLSDKLEQPSFSLTKLLANLEQNPRQMLDAHSAISRARVEELLFPDESQTE